MNQTEVFVGIYELLSNFYGALDDGTSHEAGDLFLPDATWMRQGTLLTGPVEVAAALDQRSPERVSVHQFTNLRLDGPKLEPCSFRYCLFVNIGMQKDGTATLQHDRSTAVMRCQDKAILTENGWRFASRTASIRFS